MDADGACTVLLSLTVCFRKDHIGQQELRAMNASMTKCSRAHDVHAIDDGFAMDPKE